MIIQRLLPGASLVPLLVPQRFCCRHNRSVAVILYADVEYFATIYGDAELIDGRWFFKDSYGGFYPFLNQDRVHPQNKPLRQRRYSESKSLHVICRLVDQ